MPRSTKSPRATKKATPQETNGSLPPAETSVAATVVSTPAAVTPPVKHQTHGGYTATTGPITSVDQLRRGTNVGKGTVGSFTTMESYSSYLHNLTLAELHDHAVRQARTVPIDDRLRLIKRLEMAWTEVAAREGFGRPIPKREPFTSEQMAAQAEIRKKLLRHLA